MAAASQGVAERQLAARDEDLDLVCSVRAEAWHPPNYERRRLRPISVTADHDEPRRTRPRRGGGRRRRLGRLSRLREGGRPERGRRGSTGGRFWGFRPRTGGASGGGL